MSLDWIDYAIRQMCEIPDRDSPEDLPEALIVTADEIRNAIEHWLPKRTAAAQESSRIESQTSTILPPAPAAAPPAAPTPRTDRFTYTVKQQDIGFKVTPVCVAKDLEQELDSMIAMYNAQCACTDEWFAKYNAEVERKADATLLARCEELESIAANANSRLAAAQAELQAARRDAERFRGGLEWYAAQNHIELPDWETEEGWYCPPNEESWMVEDGGVARSILAGCMMNPNTEDQDFLTILPDSAIAAGKGVEG